MNCETHRWIVHLDVDSFYVSCEIVRDPSLRNKCVAVSQFNSGGFVAVSREARAMGVRKGDGIGKNGQKELAFFRDRPDALLSSVLRRCPKLQILPMDTEYYRKCTNLLERTLENFTLWKTLHVRPIVERVSCDDFFLDITDAVYASSKMSAQVAVDVSSSESESDEETFLRKRSVPSQKPCPTYLDVSSIYSSNCESSEPITPISGDPSEYIACHIVHELRMFVKKKTGMNLSAGIARNKLLARLISKRPCTPNSQTLLRVSKERELLNLVPIRRVCGLKSQLGTWIEDNLKVRTLGELGMVSVTKLSAKVSEKKANELREWGRGIDNRAVTKRALQKSILVEKSFSPNHFNREIVTSLANTLSCRLREDGRISKGLTVTYRINYDHGVRSRALEMPTPTTAAAIENRVMCFLRSSLESTKTLTRLALSATKLQKRIQYKSGMSSNSSNRVRATSSNEKYRATVVDESSTVLKPVKKDVAEKIKKDLIGTHNDNRIVVCIDQDCFYAQVYMVENPELREKPLAVTQKNIVVTCNYVAREFGVKKLMLIEKAKQLCPTLIMLNGEHLGKFRKASREIWECVRDMLEREGCSFCIERSGLDEIFIDLTTVCNRRVGEDCDKMFAFATQFVSGLRSAILKNCGFECCAGISTSKLGAKIAVNFKKPNAQTVLPDFLPVLLSMKLEHVYGIGRKACSMIRSSLKSNVTYVRDCLSLSRTKLEQILNNPKLAMYVFLAVRGVDLTPVNHDTSWEFKSLSVGDSMRRLVTLENVSLYLKRMSEDLLKRIDDENGRVPRLLTLKVRLIADHGSRISRTCSATMPVEISQVLRMDKKKRANLLYKSAFQMFRKHFPSPFKVTLLCLTASKFSSHCDERVRQRSILECMSTDTTSPIRSNSSKDEVSYLNQISEEVLKELPPSLQKEILDHKKRMRPSKPQLSFSAKKKKKRRMKGSTTGAARNITSYFQKGFSS